MKFTTQSNQIFDQCIADYHVQDDIYATINNPYPVADVAHLLYHKNWIDTVQWHLEDVIRNPQIDPAEALVIKRWIDKSNQERTDMVEYIDSYFLQQYQSVEVLPNATINTESPAWAIDRLSILALKIFHMQQETMRTEATAAHIQACQEKLIILLEQRKDLSTAIDTLLEDIAAGRKFMKVYKQMKMYNDPALNPVLYQQSAT